METENRIEDPAYSGIVAILIESGETTISGLLNVLADCYIKQLYTGYVCLIVVRFSQIPHKDGSSYLYDYKTVRELKERVRAYLVHSAPGHPVCSHSLESALGEKHKWGRIYTTQMYEFRKRHLQLARGYLCKSIAAEYAAKGE